MPKAPPRLSKSIPRGPWRQSSTRTTTERGYGWRHQQMRKVVLREEPLCRACLAMDPPQYTPTTIADHIVPKAEGGRDDRENYQGLCDPCSAAKTAKEAARGSRRTVNRGG